MINQLIKDLYEEHVKEQLEANGPFNKHVQNLIKKKNLLWGNQNNYWLTKEILQRWNNAQSN